MKTHKIKISQFWYFLFFISCSVFWWLGNLADDPNWTITYETNILSIISFILISAAYFLYKPKKKEVIVSVPQYGEKLLFLIFSILTVLSLAVSLDFMSLRMDFTYGEGDNISLPTQVIMYAHLFFGIFFFGIIAQRLQTSKIKIIMVPILLLTPRLIVSLVWGRFYLVQALLPLIFMTLISPHYKFNWKHPILICVMGLFVFIVPPIFRGDDLQSTESLKNFLIHGSTLSLIDKYSYLKNTIKCNPFIVSSTSKMFPYSFFGLCTIDVWGEKGLPATLDRLLAYEETGNIDILAGPGSNLLLELQLSGGFIGVVLGSILFGFMNKFSAVKLYGNPVYASIWVEILTRSLLVPRSNFGYVIERIPALFIACFFLSRLLKIKVCTKENAI